MIESMKDIANQCVRRVPPTWTHDYAMTRIGQLISDAILAEREACAKVCEDYQGTLHQWTDKRKTFAAAIRARGEK